MKNLTREFIFGIALSIIFVGILLFFANTGLQTLLRISIATITILLGMLTFVWHTVKSKRDAEADVPSEDEFTKLAKVYAGNRAFMYSMYLWLLIFFFNSSFTKHETMLGIGILGSALIYWMSLWRYKTTGEFYEE